MILAIVFANLVGVIQLIILGSLGRTIRVRTVLAAMTVGLYACAPMTALLQLAWTRPAAWLMGTSISRMVGTGSYTIDPFIEEIMKVVPLTLLLMIPVIRRQWSLTDCVLIGAATGAGFGLAEELYRFSTAASGAHAIAGGWIEARSGSAVLWVPGYITSLTSWLPDGISSLQEGIRLNAHLVWTAVGGLAVGLIVLNRKREAWIAGLCLFLLVGLDHAAGNASAVGHTWLEPLNFLSHLRGVMAIGAIAAAWWLDRHRQQAGDSPELLLAVERSPSSQTSQISDSLRAAVSRPPWSILWIDNFVRMRRAYQISRVIAPEESASLYTVVVNERDRVNRALAQTESPPLLPRSWTIDALRETVRKPAFVVWFVLMAPSALWFVVGGWPPTARIQAIMVGPIIWMVVAVLSAAMQVWVGRNAIVGAREWRKLCRLPMGDDAAITGMRIACGIGAVGLGGFALLRMFAGMSPGGSLLYNAHVSEAANSMTPGDGAMVANGAGAFAPPPPSPELPDAAADPSTADGADSSSGNTQPGKPAVQPSPPSPKPTPQDDADLARKRADKARDDALEAEADALEADQRRQRAVRAADAADIAKATADPNEDPVVNDVRELARQAHDRADKADIAAADTVSDPWNPDGGKKGAADAARKDSRVADEDVQAAKDAFEERKDADAKATRAAAEKAEADSTDAADNAAAARENANAAEKQAREAADTADRNAARAADPKGAAADDAAAKYASAQKQADEAFYNSHDKPGDYQAALDEAARAREHAEATRAAADAAKEARAARLARTPNSGWKPDKP